MTQFHGVGAPREPETEMTATPVDLPHLLGELVPPRQLDRAGSRADRDTTAALLDELGFTAHDPVLAFEHVFGGVRLHEPDTDPPALVVGPYACLSAAPYSTRERDLVPVIMALDDTIYSMDARGRGWTCAAMVEGTSRPSARDGAQLLAQAILWRIVALGSITRHQGAVGAAIADSLPILSWATSDHESWWGDATRLVVEIPFGNGHSTPMTYQLDVAPG